MLDADPLPDLSVNSIILRMKIFTELDMAVTPLMDGQVGVLPTDTVYGIVARAADPKAVKQLYKLKHREHKPGTVIAASVEQLVALGVDERYLNAVKQWWPGPLSLETPFDGESGYLAQGTGHCAWRVVADEGLRALLEQTGPLQTSSANPAGEPTSVSVGMAQKYFGDAVDFYVDGGDLSDRLPSTVIRATGEHIEVIRQGAVEVDETGLHFATVPRNCPFCRTNGILKGEVLYASDGAFMIEAQSNPGNFLIIPDLHVEAPDKLPDTWWAEFKEVFAHVPGRGENYNLAMNVGRESGQTVKHLHFWVVPRVAGQPSSGKGLATLMAEVDRLAAGN